APFHSNLKSIELSHTAASEAQWRSWRRRQGKACRKRVNAHFAQRMAGGIAAGEDHTFQTGTLNQLSRNPAEGFADPMSGAGEAIKFPAAIGATAESGVDDHASTRLEPCKASPGNLGNHPVRLAAGEVHRI